ncbi:MAG: hypothetical protein WC027_01920 [Candidatus Paceibacterota bacterium]
MRIRLIAVLGVPGNMQYYGGPNPAIFKFFGEVNVDITANALGDIITNKRVMIKIAGAWVHLYRFKRRNKVFHGTGQIASTEPDRLKALVKAGWRPDLTALHYYGLSLE